MLDARGGAEYLLFMPAAHTALMTFEPFTAADLRAQEIRNVRRIADARALMADCFARADIALANGDERNFARESDGGERLAAEIFARETSLLRIRRAIAAAA
jgi:phage shock protein A